MSGFPIRRTAFWQIGAVVALTGLAGCDENGSFRFPPVGDTLESSPIVSGQTTELVERDVEAPEVFQVTQQGLWDGRPSLGGVWVAFPDVAEPERVIIRNQETGAFVIGALFRRERENPGPALQVSSDAAAALDMLAGAPATLNVTALRREEAAVPAEVLPTADFDAPSEVSEAPLDPIAGAEAALASIEAAEAASGDVASPPTASPAVPPAPAATAATTSGPTTSAPLPPSLERPYIQIGIFSVEANANNTATAMRTAGLTAQIVRQESQGSTFWRVIVGPATNEADRARQLEQVKDRGFTDAYFVRN